MSKPTLNYVTFKDQEEGLLLAVRKDCAKKAIAEAIAKEKLICEDVIEVPKYKYMYFGFGKTVGMDEYENTWWLTEDSRGQAIPVWVFREDL